MTFIRQSTLLTHKGVLAALAAAIERAEAIAVPQCIVLVDRSGETLCQFRMDGAKFTSLHTARAKARTAASFNAATGQIPYEAAMAGAAASQGMVTPLPGGLPIRFSGELAGGIGVGSGTGEQDIDVARAALQAIGADAI